jgi:uncharacterized protein (DUF433 family)
MEKTAQTQAPTAQDEPRTATYPADRVRIVSTPGTCGGRPRIDGHRITVEDIAIWHERTGMDPVEIVSAYPTIMLSEVHAALAYYFENRERVDANIVEGERFAAAMRAKAPPSLLRERLAAMGLDYEELLSMGDTDRMVAKLRESLGTK